MRAISGLWRWRGNPLCRASDLAEAWVALTALLLTVFVAPLTGVLVGGTGAGRPAAVRARTSASRGTG
ncbi:hypothetical protein SVIOM342S_03746 [Streptomyces violaceorubidus]